MKFLDRFPFFKKGSPQEPSLTTPSITIPIEIVEKYQFNTKNPWFLWEQTSDRKPIDEDIKNPLHPPTIDPNQKHYIDGAARYIVESKSIYGDRLWSRSHIYRAWDTHLEQIVAVKCSNEYEQPKGSTNELEALTLAKIDHPNIPKIYNFIRKANTPHGEMNCLVMQYLEGTNIQELLTKSQEKGKTPTIQRILNIIKTASETTSYLSSRHNLITYDTKPGNFIENIDGKIYLFDFDISNWSTQMTKDMTPGATPFVAPEILNDPTSATLKSDVYGIAIMAYELLTGNWPYTTAPEQIKYHQYESLKARERHVFHTLNTPPNPISSHKSISSKFKHEQLRQLDAIFNKALAKDPEERYPDPQLFYLEIKDILSQLSPNTTLNYAVKTPRT